MTRAGAELGAWIVGGVGMLGCAIGGALAPAQFPYAWLAAVTGWIGWPLGSLALILIHALIGGRWGLAIRPHLIAGIVTLPLLMPVLLPLLFVLHALYPWMHADVAAHLDNRFYLNAAFFYGRGVVYLTVWFGLAALVLRALCHENPEFILYRIAPPGLILLALTVTFAAFDYTLSMEPRFKSSIYGLLVGAESVLLALSAAVLGVTLAQPAERGETIESLGKLLLGLLVFWAYLDFMQLLIIWQSDLPHEANWYVRRTTGGWAVVAAVVASLHFVLPFFVLLWPQVQRSRRAMGWLAALLVAIEVPRAWWVVIPAASRTLSLLDVAAMLAVIGMAVGLALRVPRLAGLANRTAYNG
jgi:hypothetical protein